MNMKKIIIHYDEDISDGEAISLIKNVIEQGKISKTGDLKQYCFVTTYTSENGDLVYVYAADKRKEELNTFKIITEKTYNKLVMDLNNE